jgi:hypothetical protein
MEMGNCSGKLRIEGIRVAVDPRQKKGIIIRFHGIGAVKHLLYGSNCSWRWAIGTLVEGQPYIPHRGNLLVGLPFFFWIPALSTPAATKGR